MTTKQFDVSIQDKPGEIAHVADVLAKSGVNIRGASTEHSSNGAILHVISEDDVNTRKALKGAKLQFKERNVSVVVLPYKAGELAKVAHKLAEQGVNIESLFVLGGTSPGDAVAIAVDKEADAEKLLSN